MAYVKLRQQGGAVVVTIPARWLVAKRWHADDEVTAILIDIIDPQK